jgi:hypothetical protein
MESFLQPVSVADIRDVYVVDLSQVGSQFATLDNDLTELKPTLLSNTSGKKVVYFVSFYTSATQPILDKPLERWLCENMALEGASSKKSKVAFRVNFFLRSQFHHGGFARYLLPREEHVFRQWGASEVQTLAMYDGRWVWTRPEFGYQCSEFQFSSIQQQYRDWQRTKGSSYVKAKNLADFPKAFLLSEVSSLKLFKNLEDK